MIIHVHVVDFNGPKWHWYGEDIHGICCQVLPSWKARMLLGRGSQPSDMVELRVSYPLVMTNIAMENVPFIDDFPMKTSIYRGFSMAMLNNQMVTFHV